MGDAGHSSGLADGPDRLGGRDAFSRHVAGRSRGKPLVECLLLGRDDSFFHQGLRQVRAAERSFTGVALDILQGHGNSVLLQAGDEALHAALAGRALGVHQVVPPVKRLVEAIAEQVKFAVLPDRVDFHPREDLQPVALGALAGLAEASGVVVVGDGDRAQARQGCGIDQLARSEATVGESGVQV
ncbi:hypothetical protein D3C72_1725580 [compost metagenome]